MSPLQNALDEYLALRRALGHKLRDAGRLLQRFVVFADHTGAPYITTELALAWATQSATVQPAEWARRLGTVRRFAQYCSAIDPRTTIPPPDLLPYRHQRPTPYIYRDKEITRLSQWSVRWTFVKLSRQIGLRGASDSRGPRLHDLRHRLAVSTLLHWHRRGVDVERRLPALSTYLGHAPRLSARRTTQSMATGPANPRSGARMRTKTWRVEQAGRTWRK
jgi:hypothetical protein